MSIWLKQAIIYAARGLCIVPMTVDREGNKRPALKAYKQHHTKRPMDAILRDWFSGEYVDGKPLWGLGMMGGLVSGGHYCRDFDTVQAYETWKGKHLALAKTLPTVKTARGFHVHSRAAGAVKTVEFEDGELRGDKAFTVLPPSRHPKGPAYEWVIPLPDGELPLISPAEAGLDRRMIGNVTERQRDRDTETTETLNGHSVSLSHTDKISAAIAETLPTKKGTRNDNVFTFARALKAIPELKDLETGGLKEIVRQWHTRAMPVVGTKHFETTWADFCHAWPRVEFPLGSSPLDSIMETLMTRCPPPESGRYETPGVKKLIALCVELQRRAGTKPFYLDCRSAGRCIGTDHNTANRWLNMLAADRLLMLVEIGKPGRASRWRWTGER